MFSMLGGTGMGANGMGTGSVGNLTPEQLAMIMKMIQGGGAPNPAPQMPQIGGGAGMPSAPTGMPMSNTAPMSSMLGGAQPPGMAPQAPVARAPQMAPNPMDQIKRLASVSMPGGASPTIAGASQDMDMGKLFASLARGQGGITPAQGQTMGFGDILKRLFAHYQSDGLPNQNMMDLLSQQAAGNVAAGAPGL